MSNQEIRARARQLYAKYFLAVFVIGLCSEGIQGILSGVLEGYLGQQAAAWDILIQILLIPLTVGAVGCIEPLWTSEQVRFQRLISFYAPASRLVQSLLLGIIPLAAGLLVLVPSTLLVMFYGSVVLYLILLIVLLWLSMRLVLSAMLFASGRYTKALDALGASYQKMRGRMFDLIGMSLVVILPQIVIMKLLEALAEQNSGVWLFPALEILFVLLYMPYVMLCEQGWVLEQIKDSEQRQESENKRNQNPLIPEIKKGFDFEDKQT